MGTQVIANSESSDVPKRAAGEPGVDGAHGEAGAHVDGGTRAAVGEFRPADAAGTGRADRSRRLLCAGALRPAGFAAGDRVPGAELAGRQPGRNAGARAPAGTAALRILRGSRGRHCGLRGADVRAGRVGTAALGNGDGDADRVSCAFERKLPCHVHADRASSFRRGSSDLRRFAFCSRSATWRRCAVRTRMCSGIDFCYSTWEERLRPSAWRRWRSASRCGTPRNSTGRNH